MALQNHIKLLSFSIFSIQVAPARNLVLCRLRFHLLSPASRGLFAQGILEGTALDARVGTREADIPSRLTGCFGGGVIFWNLDLGLL